jgi:hypothetical protein
MTLKIITWVDNDGQYRVTSPAFKSVCETQQLDDDDLITFIIGQLKTTYSLADDHQFHIVDNDTQKTRLAECCETYFWHTVDGSPGAWEMDTDGTPIVNMAKARGIHMDEIRRMRNAELAKLDVPFMRAMEAGDTDAQATIATKKQVLRDIPQTLDLTTDTPEQLKALWPDELPARE